MRNRKSDVFEREGEAACLPNPGEGFSLYEGSNLNNPLGPAARFVFL